MLILRHAEAHLAAPLGARHPLHLRVAWRALLRAGSELSMSDSGSEFILAEEANPTVTWPVLSLGFGLRHPLWLILLMVLPIFPRLPLTLNGGIDKSNSKMDLKPLPPIVLALVGFQKMLAAALRSMARNDVGSMRYPLQHPEEDPQVPAAGPQRNRPVGSILIRNINATEILCILSLDLWCVELFRPRVPSRAALGFALLVTHR